MKSGKDFKVGDRVICSDTNERAVVAKTGTVVRVLSDLIGVEFDIHVNGHDCFGSAKHGYGWYMFPYSLEKINFRR